MQFAEAARLDSQAYEARTSLARAYRLLGRLPEALEQLRLALRIKPDYARAHAGMALVFAGQGNNASALDEYRTTERLDKEVADALAPLLEKVGVNLRAAAGTKPSAPAACPELRVDGPTEVFSGQDITFKARLIGAAPPGTAACAVRFGRGYSDAGNGSELSKRTMIYPRSTPLH